MPEEGSDVLKWNRSRQHLAGERIPEAMRVPVLDRRRLEYLREALPPYAGDGGELRSTGPEVILVSRSISIRISIT